MADNGGFFSRTSRDVELKDDGTLQASCQTCDGEWLPSKLDLNFYLANHDGKVQSASQRPGNFLATSANVMLGETTLLRGTAKRMDQTTLPFQLNLDDNVANIDGCLVWLVNPNEPHDSPDNVAIAQPRAGKITPATTKDKKDIRALVALWPHDKMDAGMKQCTMVEFPRNYQPSPYRTGWRIDNQKNGSFPGPDGFQYYSVAVQNQKPVYANVLVPVNVNVGKTVIQEAFITSMEGLKVVTIPHK